MIWVWESVLLKSEVRCYMKLFFSYGHDKNEKIVLKIKKDLESKGHKVWIDKYEIKGGDDWRSEITSGILGSEFMMSFASEHSVRDPGVCLDELMIAVSVKGARVQTVLLETDVVPPANISYRQYIDMSQWDKIKDGEEFEVWYQKKLNTILDRIDSPEIAQYAEEMEFLKQQLRPDLSGGKKERLQQEYYCGREWLSDKVDNWVKSNNNSKIMLIDGAPGIGKSSFMAHEFFFQGSVGAILFCEWDNSSMNNLDAISRNLVFQLASKLTDYRRQVVEFLKSEREITGKAYYKPQTGESIFKGLLLKQLRTLIDGERPTILILIDAVDELEDNNMLARNKNVLAELLQQEVDNFPRWIKFLITSRCDNKVLMPLKNVDIVHLDDSEEENRIDTRKYLLHELGEKFSNKEIELLLTKCDGNFLYAKMVTEAINKEYITLEDVLKGENGDLDFIYRHYFDRMYLDLDEYNEKYYSALAVLAITPEKISFDTFRKITRWSKREWNQYMKKLRPFLSVKNEFLGLYHKSFQTWLLSDEADDYIVDEYDGKKLIAEGCYCSYKDKKENMNIYEMKYLMPFVKCTDVKKYAAILLDEEYAGLLFYRAKELSKDFLYEDAVCLSIMSKEIYKNLGNSEKMAEICLFLADMTDLMVQLDESENWCRQALDIIKNDDEINLTNKDLPGQIWMRLAFVWFRNAKWEKAIEGYETAYKCFEESDNSYLQIESLLWCANTYRNTTEYSKAIEIFKKIEKLPLYNSIKDEHMNLYAEILVYYGWVLHNAGEFLKAGEYFVKAEKLLDEGMKIDFKDIAQIYFLRAVELYNQTDYDKAEEYCFKSQKFIKKAYGENAVEICSSINELGAIAQKKNDLNKAIDYFKKSYDIRVNYYGEFNFFTSISLRNYANAILDRGGADDCKKAKVYFDKVKEIRELLAESGKGVGWLAQIYSDLSNYYLIVREYEEAESYINKAYDLYREGGNGRDLSTCKMMMGKIRYSMGDYKVAKNRFDEAIGYCKEYYSEEHPYYLELMEWIGRCE